jgi:uncharacterized membrane protein YkoI
MASWSVSGNGRKVMNRRTKWIASGAAAAAIIGIGSGVAFASAGGDDNESPITGDALQKAEVAALEHTRGGRVTETEVGDEESYYEVEVTLDDGSEVDVQLDERFNVVTSESDNDDRGGEDEGSSDDDS